MADVSPSPLLPKPPLPVDSFPDRTCPDVHAPNLTPNVYENLNYDAYHQLRRRRGFPNQDSKSALKPRPLTPDQMA